MMAFRTLVSVLAIIAVVQARPQSNDFGISETLGQVSGIGATLGASFLDTTRTIGEQIMSVASDAWTTGTQALLGVNNAVRDTSVGALEGVRGAVGGAGEFIGGSVRSGGSFAADALTNGFETVRDTTNGAGTFVAGVSRTAIQSGISTAESAGDLAQDAVESIGSFASSANEATRQVVVGGIQNFSNI